MISIFDIKIGDQASQSKTFVDADVVLFACMTEDFNPIHIDRNYAEKTPFGQCVVHDMLVAGLVSSVLGTELPGPKSRLTRQNLTFFEPVYIGDTVTARVQVVKCNMDKSQILMSVNCTNQKGEIVARGDVLMTLNSLDVYLPWYHSEGMAIHA